MKVLYDKAPHKDWFQRHAYFNPDISDVYTPEWVEKLAQRWNEQPDRFKNVRAELFHVFCEENMYCVDVTPEQLLDFMERNTNLVLCWADEYNSFYLYERDKE